MHVCTMSLFIFKSKTGWASYTCGASFSDRLELSLDSPFSLGDDILQTLDASALETRIEVIISSH